MRKHRVARTTDPHSGSPIFQSLARPVLPDWRGGPALVECRRPAPITVGQSSGAVRARFRRLGRAFRRADGGAEAPGAPRGPESPLAGPRRSTSPSAE